MFPWPVTIVVKFCVRCFMNMMTIMMTYLLQMCRTISEDRLLTVMCIVYKERCWNGGSNVMKKESLSTNSTCLYATRLGNYNGCTKRNKLSVIPLQLLYV